MLFGPLGPFVTFGSAQTRQKDIPNTWVKVVTTVNVDLVDPFRFYSETIVEPGQSDKAGKQ